MIPAIDHCSDRGVFGALSASGLTELMVCWIAEGPSQALAVGELLLYGPNKTATRTIADHERLVVSADWRRIPASDEWACLLRSCGQGIAIAAVLCAQRVEALGDGGQGSFDLGPVAANTTLV